MRPTTIVVSIHPAAILRDCTPLSLQVEDIKKARDFVAGGERVVIAAGGKSAQLWLGACSNTAFWRGHWAKVDGKPRIAFSVISEDEAIRLATGKRPRKVKVDKPPKKARVKLTPEEKRTRAKSRRASKYETLKGTTFE